jgi:hypothetical protein
VDVRAVLARLENFESLSVHKPDLDDVFLAMTGADR